ncbi:response regulator transcription factor [Hydrogenophaga sp.]|uniref:response regulator transcription factor n=1 Tax=Hydrogenophaga sp. TaxID=1904254 RepID=UPI003F6ED99A
MTTCSALVVDDHPLVAESVAVLILSIAPGAVVERRETLRGCASLAGRAAPLTLIVADLSLPDASGLRALEQLRAWWPQASVVVFSGARNALLQRHCMEAGAAAFVVKTASTVELRESLQRVLNVALPRPTLALPTRWSDGELSPKQEAVWRDLASGLSNQEIAQRHGVSINTVKTHVRELFERIGVRNRTEAARLYAER